MSKNRKPDLYESQDSKIETLDKFPEGFSAEADRIAIQQHQDTRLGSIRAKVYKAGKATPFATSFQVTLDAYESADNMIYSMIISELDILGYSVTPKEIKGGGFYHEEPYVILTVTRGPPPPAQPVPAKATPKPVKTERRDFMPIDQ